MLKGSTIAILTEGMGGRLKTKGGQLVPLKQRLGRRKMEKRETKVIARQTVAEQLRREQRQFMLGMAKAFHDAFFGRSFFGRMKLMLVGR